MDVGYDSSLERRTSWRERAAAEQRQRQIEDAPHLKIVDSIEAVHNHGDQSQSDCEQIVTEKPAPGQFECILPIAISMLT